MARRYVSRIGPRDDYGVNRLAAYMRSLDTAAHLSRTRSSSLPPRALFPAATSAAQHGLDDVRGVDLGDVGEGDTRAGDDAPAPGDAAAAAGKHAEEWYIEQLPYGGDDGGRVRGGAAAALLRTTSPAAAPSSPSAGSSLLAADAAAALIARGGGVRYRACARALASYAILLSRLTTNTNPCDRAIVSSQSGDVASRSASRVSNTGMLRS